MKFGFCSPVKTVHANANDESFRRVTRMQSAALTDLFRNGTGCLYGTTFRCSKLIWSDVLQESSAEDEHCAWFVGASNLCNFVPTTFNNNSRYRQFSEISDPSSSEISNVVVEIELLKTNISTLQECVQVRPSRFME